MDSWSCLILFVFGVIITSIPIKGDINDVVPSFQEKQLILNKGYIKKIIRVRRQAVPGSGPPGSEGVDDYDITFHCYDHSHHIRRCLKRYGPITSSTTGPKVSRPATLPHLTTRSADLFPPRHTQRTTTFGGLGSGITLPRFESGSKPPRFGSGNTQPRFGSGHSLPRFGVGSTPPRFWSGHTPPRLPLSDSKTNLWGPGTTPVDHHRRFPFSATWPTLQPLPKTTIPWWWPGPKPNATTIRPGVGSAAVGSSIPVSTFALAAGGVCLIIFIIIVVVICFIRRKKKDKADLKNRKSGAKVSYQKEKMSSLSKPPLDNDSCHITISPGSSIRKVPFYNNQAMADDSYVGKEEISIIPCNEGITSDEAHLSDTYEGTMSQGEQYNKSIKSLPEVSSLTLQHEIKNEPPPRYSIIENDSTYGNIDYVDPSKMQIAKDSRKSGSFTQKELENAYDKNKRRGRPVSSTGRSKDIRRGRSDLKDNKEKRSSRSNRK